ncbi:MAG TPA: hypothetical protein VEK10_10910, partial [Steroidobacteraceae bacterium]|nr:hypothetical protein [Steroidobacteraceae bacterium]
INNNVTVNRVSYNGGAGGIHAVPTAQERMAAQEQHVAPTPEQHQHVRQAAANPALLAKNNGGRPAIAATPRPSAFNAPGVLGSRGAGNAPLHASQPNGAHPAPNHGQPSAAHPNPGQPNGAHTQPYAGAHPQNANGKPPAAKPHPKTPENGKHEETAQR